MSPGCAGSWGNVTYCHVIYLFQIGDAPDKEDPVSNVTRLCRELGNITIVQKGAVDIISDGQNGKYIGLYEKFNSLANILKLCE